MDRPLDVRMLPAPEPMQLVLEALFDLPSTDRLLVRLRREPFPLYDILKRMGYRWETSGGDNDFTTLIWREDTDSCRTTHAER